MAEGSERQQTTTKKLTIVEANKTSREQKFLQRKFIHKVRAVFRSKSQTTSTFRFLPAMKGLQEQIFMARQGEVEIVNNDESKGYSKNMDFPKESELQDFYQIDHGEKDRGQTNVVVVFKIACDCGVGELKKSGMMQYLAEQNIYVNPHKFQTVRIKKIGFITHVHPAFTNAEDYAKEAEANIKTFVEQIDTDNEEIDEDMRQFSESKEAIPKFEVVINGNTNYRKPLTNEERKSKNNQPRSQLKTTTYEIQCEAGNATTLSMLLMIATHDDMWQIGRFIPYAWARQNPEAYIQALKEQIEFMETTN